MVDNLGNSGCIEEVLPIACAPQSPGVCSKVILGLGHPTDSSWHFENANRAKAKGSPSLVEYIFADSAN